jgi:hypothetical protein
MTNPSPLGRSVEKLAGQVSHWTPSRWAASSASGPTRAEVVHSLVQWLADAGADAEGHPRRPVPRLDNDLALPDQLRVMARDLTATGDQAAIERARELVAAAAASI